MNVIRVTTKIITQYSLVGKAPDSQPRGRGFVVRFPLRASNLREGGFIRRGGLRHPSDAPLPAETAETPLRHQVRHPGRSRPADPTVAESVRGLLQNPGLPRGGGSGSGGTTPLGTIKTDAVILARVRSCRVLCSVLGVGISINQSIMTNNH